MALPRVFLTFFRVSVAILPGGGNALWIHPAEGKP